MKVARAPRIPSLATFKPRMERQLQAIFAAALTDASELDDNYARLIEQLQDQTLRAGKRLRPYLAYVAYLGSGGREPQAFMPVAASLELVHQFLLVHDDIIDRDLVRYGGPNIAGHYGQQFESVGLSPAAAGHYASAYALLAGDAAWAVAQRGILSSDFSATRKLAAMDCLQQKIFEVIGGQLMDVKSGIPGAAPASIEHLLGISRYKTANYTFQMPLQVGALMAGDSRARQQQLADFGATVGVAFQLADDILGVFGEEAALGKSVLSDLREGKQTLLVYHAYCSATPAQVRELRRIWGNRESGPADLARAQEIIRATGALDKVQALADQYVSEGLAQVELLPLGPAAQAELARIATFAAARKF